MVPDDEGDALLLGDTAAVLVVETVHDTDGAGDEDAVMDVTTPAPSEHKHSVQTTEQNTHIQSQRYVFLACDDAVTILLASAVSSSRATSSDVIVLAEPVDVMVSPINATRITCSHTALHTRCMRPCHVWETRNRTGMITCSDANAIFT